MDPIEQNQTFFAKLWEKLSGSPSSFSMENRLFNAVSVVTFIALLVALVSNHALGIASLYIVITIILQCILYYFSRVKKQFAVPAIIYCIATYAYFITNYFYNAGITGPTIMGFVSAFILIVALGPISWPRLWIVLHVLIVLALIAMEYFKIVSIEGYASEKERFIDIGVSYLISITIMYFVIVYIRNNYIKERSLAEQYADSILKQNKELEELNQVKNRLFSIISHDLRSPLNSIQGYLEVLTDSSFPENEKSKIQEQLLHLTRHTQDMLFNLLSWSKSQLSGNTIELQDVNVNDTLNATLEILEVAAANKGIALKNFIDHSLTIKANADMLQLVVRNLIQNAIKFSNVGGEISVGACRNGKEGLITVKDNGIGIPLEKQADIFSSKLRSAYGTNKEKGIGLGLYLCRELIELQNGRIWFNSKPGQGSEFSFALPLP